MIIMACSAYYQPHSCRYFTDGQCSPAPRWRFHLWQFSAFMLGKGSPRPMTSKLGMWETAGALRSPNILHQSLTMTTGKIQPGMGNHQGQCAGVCQQWISQTMDFTLECTCACQRKEQRAFSSALVQVDKGYSCFSHGRTSFQGLGSLSTLVY